MRAHDLSRWQHEHDFAPDRQTSERRTHWVIGITMDRVDTRGMGMTRMPMVTVTVTSTPAITATPISTTTLPTNRPPPALRQPPKT